MADQEVVTKLTIEADTSGADQFVRAMDGAAKAAGDGVSSLAGFAIGGVSGIAGALGLSKLLTQIVNVNKEFSDLDLTARQVGLTLSELQSTRFAANISGLDTDAFNSGLQKSASLLNDAQRNANSLTKLLDENGISVRNTNGQLISENQLLASAANLVARAATEQDKIKIAQMLGFTREWVPFLEQGANAIEDMASGAKDAGVIINENTIKKAKEFDQEWRRSSAEWSANLKAAASTVLPVIDQLISKAGGIFTKENLRWLTSGVTSETLKNAGFLNPLPELSPEKTAADYAAFMKKQASADHAQDLAQDAADGAHTKIPGNEVAANSFDRSLEQLAKHTARTEADTQAVGLGASALAEFRATAQLTTAALQSGLDPASKKLADQIQDLAQDAGDAALALEKAKVASSIDFASKTAFLSPEDLAVAQQLKGIYGNDVPAALASTEAAAIKTNMALKQINDTGLDTVKGFAIDFKNALTGGANAWKSFEQAGSTALNKISDKLMQMGIDNLWGKAFGGASGGLGGLLGSLFGFGGSSATSGAVNVVGGAGSMAVPTFFATGTDDAPGGWATVGEQGPEKMYVPKGAKILPHGKEIPGSGPQQVRVSVGVSVDNDGNLQAYVKDVSQETAARGITAFAKSKSFVQSVNTANTKIQKGRLAA